MAERNSATDWQVVSQQSQTLPIEPQVAGSTWDDTIRTCGSDVLARCVARLVEQSISVCAVEKAADLLDSVVRIHINDGPPVDELQRLWNQV